MYLQLERPGPDGEAVDGEHVGAAEGDPDHVNKDISELARQDSKRDPSPVNPVPEVKVRVCVDGGGGEVHVAVVVVKRLAGKGGEYGKSHKFFLLLMGMQST